MRKKNLSKYSASKGEYKNVQGDKKERGKTENTSFNYGSPRSQGPANSRNCTCLQAAAKRHIPPPARGANQNSSRRFGSSTRIQFPQREANLFNHRPSPPYPIRNWPMASILFLSPSHPLPFRPGPFVEAQTSPCRVFLVPRYTNLILRPALRAITFVGCAL